MNDQEPDVPPMKLSLVYRDAHGALVIRNLDSGYTETFVDREGRYTHLPDTVFEVVRIITHEFTDSADKRQVSMHSLFTMDAMDEDKDGCPLVAAWEFIKHVGSMPDFIKFIKEKAREVAEVES
jgi:hypothetical protein